MNLFIVCLWPFPGIIFYANTPFSVQGRASSVRLKRRKVKGATLMDLWMSVK